MESPDEETRAPSIFGDRSTSDVVVRLRTQEGRDDWFYCHSHILIKNSKYFADRLSENWPTCQILDSRSCVEVFCQESEFNHHVTVLRLFYVVTDGWLTGSCHGVRNALGILQVAVELGCQHMISACVGYLEAVPWEEAEEEEILRVIPSLGSPAEPVLSRLQPVDQAAIIGVFFSVMQFATSSPPFSMNELKSVAQEQLDYMLTEDDDAPLLKVNEEVKYKVTECISKLLARFYDLLEYLLFCSKKLMVEGEKILLLQSLLSDLAWACQILTKMETVKEFVHSWVEASDNIVKVIENSSPSSDMLETKLRVIVVVAKVLEVIGYGSVILPTTGRLHMVKVWFPFVRVTRSLFDSISIIPEYVPTFRMDCEVWQILESAFVSIILALPSGAQAEILTDWLGNEHIRYPDLTEAFEAWCYRSKVAKRRLASLGSFHSETN